MHPKPQTAPGAGPAARERTDSGAAAVALLGALTLALTFPPSPAAASEEARPVPRSSGMQGWEAPFGAWGGDLFRGREGPGTSVRGSPRFLLYGDAGTRVEWRGGGGDGGISAIQRTRLGLRARLGRGSTLRLEGEDARGLTGMTGAWDDGGTRLRLGQLRLGSLRGGGPSLTLGRQPMHLGEGKLLGSFDWGDGGRTFDGARLSLRDGEGRWVGELFRMELDRQGGRELDGQLLGFYNRFHFGDYPGRRRGIDPYLPARSRPGREAPLPAGIRDGARVQDWDDWARADAVLFGRRELERGRFHALDAYLMLRDGAGGSGSAGGRFESYTLGVRSDGRTGRWGYAFEGAYQFGAAGGKEIRAHAIHARLSGALPGRWKPVVLVELNRATGDGDPSDGTWERFDNLFPDNHLHYGHADLFSWTNLNHLRLGISVRPTRRSGLSLDLHHFAVESAADGWYDAEGNCLGEGSGNGPREVGWEVDVTYRRDWAPGLSVLAGYAYFEPSGFAESVGEDGARHRLFLQTRFRY